MKWQLEEEEEDLLEMETDYRLVNNFYQCLRALYI